MDTPQDYLTLVQPWRAAEERTIARTPIFSLLGRHFSSVTDPARAGEFVVLECPTWANVIAITEDRRVVFVEQFRAGLNQVTLEIPGGMVEVGEDPGAACARELREETGFEGPGVRLLGRVSANPAIQNNWCYTGLVEGARPAGPQTLDHREEAAVRLVPLAEIPTLIRDGVIHHSLVVGAFHHLLLDGMARAGGGAP